MAAHDWATRHHTIGTQNKNHHPKKSTSYQWIGGWHLEASDWLIPCTTIMLTHRMVNQIKMPAKILVIGPNGQHTINWVYGVRLRWNECCWIHKEGNCDLMLLSILFGHFQFWAKIWSPDRTYPLGTFGLQKFTSLVNIMRLILKSTQKLNPNCLLFNWHPLIPNYVTSPIFLMKSCCPVKNWAKIIIDDRGTKY